MTTYEQSRYLKGEELPKYYFDRLCASEAKWERAKAEFVRLRKGFVRGLEPGTAEYATAEFIGSQDKYVKTAMGDCAFYANEVRTYASLIQALNAMKEITR